jgi:uncharacterized protein (TIGR00251 family)
MRKITINVKPNSKKPNIEESSLSVWIVRIKEPAIDGKANEGVIKAIAKYLNVPKTKVNIIRGYKSRIKVIEIDD